MMKLLFLNTNIGYGGASKMMAWVASQFAEAGHDVIFFTYRDAKCSQILNPKVKHIHEQLEDSSSKRNSFITCVRYLHNYIKQEKFDIAIAFLSPSIVRLALAAKRTQCKTLFSERADPSRSAATFKEKFIDWLIRRLFCSADAFVFQTPMAASFFPKDVQERGVVISNPITPLLRTKDRVVGGDKNIVCVARLDLAQKRQDLLIDAFNLISNRYPDYTLQLYGNGFTKNDERILREKAKNNPRIHFMGPTNDIVEAIQCATMFVLSSDFEGIPNALLESMSLGIPSVSTDCSPGGAAMLIRNYVNGILVPRKDVKALAEAMEYIILRPIDAETMGKTAMEVNWIYAEKEISDKWLRFIESIK